MAECWLKVKMPARNGVFDGDVSIGASTGEEIAYQFSDGNVVVD
jgi:hypothetical protein